MRFYNKMAAFPSEALDRGLVHADLQGYHTHIAADGSMSFFDFDCCALGYRAYDLAVFRWFARLQQAEAARWEPFLRGYCETRPLAELDIQAIPYLVAGGYLWHVWLHTVNATHWGHGWLKTSISTDCSRISKQCKTIIRSNPNRRSHGQ